MAPTVFITGASAGIGAATARAAAKAGYDVAIGYRSGGKGAQMVAEEVRAMGQRAELIQGDIGNLGALPDIWEKFDSHFERLDALVNNAGIVSPKATVTGYDIARIEQVFRINTLAPILLCAEAVRRMSTDADGDGGAIVNLSSAAARLGSPGEYIDYAASKAAIDTFTKGLALEVATQGIRVNAVRPGIIDTEIHARGGQPDRLEQMGPLTPMKRAGTAEEVADAVVWLLGAQASYVTGTTLDVTGGR